MKNFRLLLLVLSMLLAVPKIHAEWVVGETRIPSSAIPDMAGKYVVLESAMNASYAGYYVTSASTSRTTLVDSAAIWTLVPIGNNKYCGRAEYLLKNVKTGTYLDFPNGESVTTKNGINVVISSATEAPFDYNGITFDLASKAHSTNEPGWDENSVTLGYVFESGGDVDFYFVGSFWNNKNALWGKSNGDDFYRATNAWNIYPATWEDNPQADLQLALDEFDLKGYATLYAGGNDPFQTSLAAYTAMMNAYETALTELGNDHTADEYRAYEKALRQAVATAAASANPMTDGYYFVKTANSNFTQHSDTTKKHMGWYAYNDYLAWSMVGAADSALYVWRIKATEDGGYTMQNMSNGYYVKGSNTVNHSQYVRLSANPVTQQIKHLGGGHISVCKLGNTYSYGYYHQGGHNNGGGTNSYVVTWSEGQSNGSAWRLEAVTDKDLIARLEQSVAQNILNNKMTQTLAVAESDSAQAMVTSVIGGTALVTSADQLYGNNRQGNEGSIANLLDNNTNTYYHSAWGAAYDTEDEYHYMQFNSPTELPGSIKLFYQRRMNNNNNRPTKAILSVSNDGVNWTNISDTLVKKHVVDTVTGATEGVLPTVNTDNIFFSEAFTVPSGMTKLRFTVFETNNNALSPTYQHPFITFSEFNVYPGTAKFGSDITNSQALRPDMKPAYDNLVAAIATARALLNDTVRKVTQEDIDALQATIDALEALWVDTVDFKNNIALATRLIDNAVVGEEVGQFAEASVAALQQSLTEVKARAPYYELSKTDFVAVEKQLEDALSAFNSAMVVPEDGWYYIVSNVSEKNRPEDSKPTRGRVVYAAGQNVGSAVKWGGLVSESETNGLAGWAIKSLGDGTYSVQNVGSGWYLGQGGTPGTNIVMSDTVVPYRYVSLGNGELTLQPACGNPHLHAQWDYQVAVTWTGVAGSASSWTFEQVSADAFTDVKSYATSGLHIITVPYNTAEAPYAVSGGQVEFFDLVGVAKGEDGVITALNLGLHSGALVGGTPYLMRVMADGEDPVMVDMLVDQTAALTCTSTTANGLVGALRSVVLNEEGRGYLEAGNDSVLVSNAADPVTIAAQAGYIVPSQVRELDCEIALSLPVVGGGSDFVNAIESVIAPKNGTVNVYTIDGVQVRRNVSLDKAVSGLPKGLYIVGGKKVLVR